MKKWKNLKNINQWITIRQNNELNKIFQIEEKEEEEEKKEMKKNLHNIRQKDSALSKWKYNCSKTI